MQDARLLADLHMDGRGRIAQDLACVRCGYNLRGLAPEGRCPECGTPIGRSVRGNLLQYSDPNWVERIARGMTWVVAAIGAQILFAIAEGYLTNLLRVFGVTVGQSETVFQILRQAGELVMLGGFWQATVADPGDLAAQEFGPRQIARYALTVAVVGGVFRALAGIAAGQPSQAMYLAVEGVRIAGYFALGTYASRLALRIPDEPLARQTRIVMWGTLATGASVLLLAGAATVFGRGKGSYGSGAQLLGACFLLLIAVGWLVFGIGAIVILINFQGKLRECALAARYTWARDAARTGVSGPRLPSHP